MNKIKYFSLLLSVLTCSLFITIMFSCNGDDDDTEPTPTATPTPIDLSDGMWVMTYPKPNYFNSYEFDIGFCVSADTTKIYIVEYEGYYSESEIFNFLVWCEPPFGIPINNYSFFLDWGDSGSTSGQFLNKDHAQGYSNIQWDDGTEKTYDWQANACPSKNGFPHNGMWYGKSEEDLPIWFVISKNGDCLVFFFLSIGFENHPIYSGIGFYFLGSILGRNCEFTGISEILNSSFSWTDTYEDRTFYCSGTFTSPLTSSGTMRVVFDPGETYPDGWDSGEISWQIKYGGENEYYSTSMKDVGGGNRMITRAGNLTPKVEVVYF